MDWSRRHARPIVHFLIVTYNDGIDDARKIGRKEERGDSGNKSFIIKGGNKKECENKGETTDVLGKTIVLYELSDCLLAF